MNKTARGTLVTLTLCLPIMAYSSTKSDKMVVTATSFEQKVDFLTQRSVTVIDHQKLRESQPTSVADALKNEANVSISGGPRALAQEINIRGLTDNRVLQLVDGARQNVNIGLRAGAFIEPELLKKIKVVRGPVGNLYGSGALGGVVLLKTKSATDLLNDQQQLGSYFKQSYQSNGDLLKSNAAIYGRNNQFDWLVNGVYSNNHNIRLGDKTPLRYSGDRTKAGLIKLGWQLSDAQKINLSTRLNEIKATVPVAPAFGYHPSTKLIQRTAKSENMIIEYDLFPADINWLNTHAVFYGNKTSYDEHHLTLQQNDGNTLKTLGFNIINQARLPYDITLDFGVDGYQDHLTTVRDGRAAPAPEKIADPMNARSHNWGLYANSQLPISDFFIIESGLRYDYYTNKDRKNNKSVSDSAISPSLALIFDPATWLTLTTRYDEAFRAPALMDMYNSGVHDCANGLNHCRYFMPNVDLRPEKAKNKELQVDFHFNDLLGDDELRFVTSLFRNDVKDLMERERKTYTIQYKNVTKARFTGFESSINYRYQLTHLQLSYSQTMGKNKLNHSALSGVPVNKLVANVSQGLVASEITLGTRVAYHAQQNKKPLNHTNDYPHYTLWDIYATWQPSYRGLAGFTFDFAIDNITDRRYRQAWQALDGQGRNIKLSTSYRF